MTKKELIKKLQEFPDDTEIRMFDKQLGEYVNFYFDVWSLTPGKGWPAVTYIGIHNRKKSCD